MNTPAADVPDEPLRTRSALEAGFRAILALFAAVLGFGLKHILDLEHIERLQIELLQNVPEELKLLAQHRWPMFIITTAVFARYFIGASVHVTFEHIHRAANTTRGTFLQDVMFLGLYALIGMGVSYSTTLNGGLLWLLALHGLALIWAGFDRQVRKYQPLRSDAPWGFFIRTNLIGITGLVFALYVMWRWPDVAFASSFPELPPWNWYWLSLAAGAAILLVVDLKNQLKVIGVGH